MRTGENPIIEVMTKLCTLQGKDPIDINKVEAYALLGQLCMHRCAGAAYKTLEAAGQLASVNREMRTTLQLLYSGNVRKNQSMKQCLGELAEILSKEDFPYGVLKGAVLVYLYPEGVRTSNDIDLLVNRRDLTQVTQCLLSNGFSQGYIRNNRFVPATRRDIVNALVNRGETTPFIKQVDLPEMKFLEVDVNISLDETAFQKETAVSEMLQKRRMDENCGLYTLDKVDFLIHLCTHLYKEASVYQWVQMGRDLSLYKFLDIYLFCQREFSEEDVTLFVNRAKQYQVEEACYYALYHTSLLWDMEKSFIEGILEGLKRKDLGFLDEVYNPEDHKIYGFTLSFPERLFLERRNRYLREAGIHEETKPEESK